MVSAKRKHSYWSEQPCSLKYCPHSFLPRIPRWQEFFAGNLVKALHIVNIHSSTDPKQSIASQKEAAWKLKSLKSFRGHQELSWGSHDCNPSGSEECSSQYQLGPGIHSSKKQSVSTFSKWNIFLCVRNLTVRKADLGYLNPQSDPEEHEVCAHCEAKGYRWATLWKSFAVL